MEINGKQVELKIDTGAKCNVITLDLFNWISRGEEINKSGSVQLVAYGRDTFTTLGTANFDCHLGSTDRIPELNVVDKPVSPPLGLVDSLSLNLIQLHSEIHEVDTADAFRTTMLNEYKDLFQGNLGNLPVVYKMRLDPNAIPVVRPACKLPLAMEKSVKRERERIKIGAITPVSEPNEWISQMVAVKKKDGSIRICIDPRDLNRALKRPHHPMRTVEDVAFSKFQGLINLQKKNGLEISSTYANDKPCTEMVSVLGKVFKERTTAEINQSKYISVMADGAMDVGGLDNQTVFC